MDEREITHCDVCPAFCFEHDRGRNGAHRCKLYGGDYKLPPTSTQPPDWCPLRAGVVQLRYKPRERCSESLLNVRCGLVDGHRYGHMRRLGGQEMCWGEYSNDILRGSEHDWHSPLDSAEDSE